MGLMSEYMKTFSLVTFGCKVNQYESQVIREALTGRGLKEVAPFEADISIIDTCAVTGESQGKGRRAVRRARRKNPTCLIVATGCSARIFAQELQDAGASFVEPDKQKILSLLFPVRSDKRSHQPHTLAGITNFQGHSRAFIKIQDGCQEFCSYCIIPYVRPFPTSRAKSEVVAEARRLAEAGYKELVLAGINLGRYAGGLSNLVLALQKIEGVERIRLSSIEASDVDQELLGLAKYGKLAPHFHLPLQSGDDQILHKMNRHYTARDYLRRLDEIRSYLDQPAITSDIMVGFPGESEEAFRCTVEVTKAASFARTHIFPFSPRPGTRAHSLPGRVPSKVIRRRKEGLKEVAEESAIEFKKKFIGKKARVLVEYPPRNLPGCPSVAGQPGSLTGCQAVGPPASRPLSGYTEHYLRVKFPGPRSLVGQMVDVEITGLEEGFLQGRKLD